MTDALAFYIDLETADRVEYTYGPPHGRTYFSSLNGDLGIGAGMWSSRGIVLKDSWKETGKLSIQLQYENEKLRNRVATLEIWSANSMKLEADARNKIRELMSVMGICEHGEE